MKHIFQGLLLIAATFGLGFSITQAGFGPAQGIGGGGGGGGGFTPVTGTFNIPSGSVTNPGGTITLSAVSDPSSWLSSGELQLPAGTYIATTNLRFHTGAGAGNLNVQLTDDPANNWTIGMCGIGIANTQADLSSSVTFVLAVSTKLALQGASPAIGTSTITAQGADASGSGFALTVTRIN